MQSIHHRIKQLTVYILIFFVSFNASAKTVEEAYAQIEKGNTDTAVDILQKIIQKNPKNYAAHLTLGYAHMLKERYGKALESYRKADEINSTLDSLSGIQWALLALGQHDESIKTGEKILEKDPKNFYARYRIAESLFLQKKYDAAVKYYKTLETDFPKNQDVLWKLALCELYQGRMDASADYFQKMLQENPNNYSAHLNLGYISLVKERPAKALEHYRKADEIYPSLDAQSGIQWSLLALGKHDESIKTGEKILEKDPKNYFARYRIAESRLAQKDYENAGKLYKSLQADDPKNTDILWKLGLCEYYQGNTSRANSYFEEGLKNDPKHKGLRYSLGLPTAPSVEVSPEYTTYSFRGSDFIGSGYRTGLSAMYMHDENWTFKAGYVKDTAENLNSSKGVQNYITDKFNLLQYSYYTSPSQIVTYLSGTYNMYNLLSLASSQDYSIQKGTFGTSYRYSADTSFFFSTSGLQSNFKALNSSYSAVAGVSYKSWATYTLSGGYVKSGDHSGVQGTVNMTIPFLDWFYSSTGITGQYMGIRKTEYYLLYANPTTTLSQTIDYTKRYGFLMQEFGFAAGMFNLAAGFRLGTARTPIIGDNWIYTNFDMMGGGYISGGFKWDEFGLQIQHTQDKWNDSRNEKPTSAQTKIILSWRFE